MEIKENVSLINYSTMHLGGRARNLVEIQNKDQLLESLKWAKQHNLKTIMIGSGSNIIWKDEGFNGLVIVNRIKGFELITLDQKYILNIGAGEVWDEVVQKASEELKLSGIEALSLIPGNAGAVPVQNVGAYGQQISDILISVSAYDNLEDKFIELDNQQCNFSYRNSLFKKEINRFFVTGLSLALTKDYLKGPFYPSLQKYLEENQITDYSPISIRKAVINIRNQKLPNPKDYYNCGSFFQNPIIPSNQLEDLKKSLNIEIPHWSVGNNLEKLSAAWLIEKAGYSKYHDTETGMATWKNQPLVLVNELASSTQDLISFRDKIVERIRSQFGITLVQEPQLLP